MLCLNVPHVSYPSSNQMTYLKRLHAYTPDCRALFILGAGEDRPMSAALPIFDVLMGKQAGNIFCLNDQTNIACFMIIRGV